MIRAIRYTRFFPDSRFPIPDSRLPIPDSQLPTADSLLPTPYSLLPNSSGPNYPDEPQFLPPCNPK
ncbi:hypothetical protein [Moorena sp. SIO3H5]|uniref:hypothetical protein n=1 Tax=Moorena sp. SIO3H5 TaxID=2607834 RepID=UPI0013B76774|nr:hypothetical protein [Moorena sp. SIO3H5]NEO69264.1 hypothetical protein [Moorena sp. SIO3H5]